MKTFALAIPAAFLALAGSPALAAETAAPAPAKLSTADSTLGALLDDPAAKAVLQKHIAEMISNPQIEMARSMTLKQLQGFAGDALSDEILARIDQDLARLPAK